MNEMIRNVELNHLKYFYYTVLEGGLAQAASQLNVQQPVVSKMLKSLEEDLGQALFWKKGRSKRLTDYGQLVYRHCQVVFGEINKIGQLSERSDEVRDVLNIGASEPIANYILPEKIDKLMSHYPKLHINCYMTTQSHIGEMVSGGRLDMGLLFYLPSLPGNLEIIKRIPYRFSIVVKSDLQDHRETLESFIGSREVDDTGSHCFPTVELMRRKYPATRITFSSNSITLHKHLVEQGRGVAILPRFLVEKEIEKNQFKELHSEEDFEFDLMIVKRKAETLSKTGERLVHLISDEGPPSFHFS